MERAGLEVSAMSIWNQEHNVLFIHVPKTAGTSMERQPFLGGGGHQTIRDYSDVDDVFKFAFVRNPWDRYVSAWFCQHGVDFSDRSGFNQYIRDECSGDTYPEKSVHAPHSLPQWHFLLDDAGEIGVDFVGRFEMLKRDWEYVCARLSVSAQLRHERRRAHWPYREYYVPDTWEIIGRLYQRDVELFGYEEVDRLTFEPLALTL
jgi:hypothetical protein